MRSAALLLLLPALGACDGFPRDQDGTLQRIRQDKVVRVGVVSSDRPSPHRGKLRELVGRSAAAGGRPLILQDSAEPLLLALEGGEIDLVVGEFDASSPWHRRVHMIPPLATEQRSGSRVEVTAAARSGENGWIMLLERQGRFIGGGS